MLHDQPPEALMEPGGVRHVLRRGRSQLDQVGVNQPVEGLRGVGVGISGRKGRVSRKEVKNGGQSGSTTRCNLKRKESVCPTNTRPRTFTAHHS